jgi:hypothetical protein
VDELFPGFEAGDFAVLYGTAAVLPLSLLLCVKAQLPPQLGGLGQTLCSSTAATLSDSTEYPESLRFTS